MAMHQKTFILPDFIIIGAMKAGTTALYHCLSRHPEVGMSKKKETNFFLAENRGRLGLEWYHAQFSPGFRCYGEASPNYTKARDFKGVPERISNTVPDCKFVYIVRDPVNRFISHYTHACLSGLPVPDPDKLYGHHEWFHMIDASLYYRQIMEYLAYTSLEAILIVTFEQLTRRPHESLNTIADFLEVERCTGWAWATGINSSTELARLPLWVYRAYQAESVQSLLKYSPSPLIKLFRSGIARSGVARQVKPLSDALKAEIAVSVFKDTERLRALTGKRFEEWSV